jgi:cell division protein FtsW (lipid II flippase)
MRAAARWRELRLLVPLIILAPGGLAIIQIAGLSPEPGLDAFNPGLLQPGLLFVALFAAAHLGLVLGSHRGDQLLLPVVATLGTLGLLMLSRLPQEMAGTSLPGFQLGMAATQLLWFAVGLAAMVTVAYLFRDESILRHYKYTWAVAGALLMLVTLLFGREVNGARLWLDIGPISFQPGEFIKIVLVVFLAAYLAERRALLAGAFRRVGPIAVPPLPYLLPMLAMFAVVMLIVVVMNDLGTGLLFFGIFLTMLFVATGRRSYVLIGLLLFVAGSVVAHRLFSHVATRVDTWLDPFADPLGNGYQNLQALYAFGRGGLFGEGLGQGLTGFVPQVHTDFIFTALAEELGLIGAFAILAFALLLIFRGLRVAMRAHDDFSALLAVGLTASLGIQTLIIAAGNLKLVPLTGITFPFLSYGGSSLLASFIVIGLLMAISHRSAVTAAEAAT